MLKQGIDGHLVTVHDVQDSLGGSRLEQQLRQSYRYGGVLFGWLQHECVAAGNRDAKHPHRNHRGEVEGRDARPDSDRLTHGIDIDLRACSRRVLAFERMGNAAGKLDDLEPTLQISFRVGDDLAVL